MDEPSAAHRRVWYLPTDGPVSAAGATDVAVILRAAAGGNPAAATTVTFRVRPLCSTYADDDPASGMAVQVIMLRPLEKPCPPSHRLARRRTS